MSDLLQEAEDELRRENVQNTAKKAMPYVIAAVVLALAIGGGIQYWRSEQVKATATASNSYYDAMKKLQQGDIDGGVAALEAITKTAPAGFRALASIQRAAVLQERGDNTGALAAFDAAAKVIKDKDISDLALLRAAYIAAETETPEKLSARLDIIIKHGGAFSHLARELKAASAWAKGDASAAKAEYELLQIDPNSPQGVKARAGQALAVIKSGASASTDLMPMAQQGGADGQQGAPAGANEEIGPDGKRIVRLPPGMKLPPNFKAPPNVTFIETPLPAGAQAPQAGAPNREEMLNDIERERQKAMREQEAVTKAQQKQVDEINKAQSAPVAPANAPTAAPVPEPTKTEGAPQ